MIMLSLITALLIVLYVVTMIVRYIFSSKSDYQQIDHRTRYDGTRPIGEDDVVHMRREGPAIVLTVEGSPTAMMYDTAGGGYRVIYIETYGQDVFYDYPSNRNELMHDVIGYYNDNIYRV